MQQMTVQKAKEKLVPTAFSEAEAEKMFDLAEKKFKELGIDKIKGIKKTREDGRLEYEFKVNPKDYYGEEYMRLDKAISCSGFNQVSRIDYKVSGHCDNGKVKVYPRNAKNFETICEAGFGLFVESIKKAIEKHTKKVNREKQHANLKKKTGHKEVQDDKGRYKHEQVSTSLGTIRSYITARNEDDLFDIQFSELTEQQVLDIFKALRK